MKKQQIERILMSYTKSKKGSLMTAVQFSEYCDIRPETARRKLKEANVEKQGSKYFIASIADRIYQGVL